MKLLRALFILSAFGFLSTSCEDIIDVNVDQKQKKIVVDAFVNNLDTTQQITLTESVPYFATPGTEPFISDATVLIADTSASNFKIFPFIHKDSGVYEWTPKPSTGDTFQVGRQYALIIIHRGDTLISACRLNPTVSVIDSLSAVPVEGNGPPFIDSGKYVELFANDLPGMGNFYWVKTFRNDSFLNDIRNLNISQDMGNNSNGQDGGLFIYPIRFSGINQFLRPYRDGEKVRVEVHSITLEAFFWFNLIVNERNNGGLFATPPVNIQSNIIPLNKNMERGVAGFFCISDVRSAEIRIKEF
jgi:hypothetical protein